MSDILRKVVDIPLKVADISTGAAGTFVEDRTLLLGNRLWITGLSPDSGVEVGFFCGGRG